MHEIFWESISEKNKYLSEITFLMVGYGDLMGLNCNKRGHVFVSQGVWMLDVYGGFFMGS
jgi:hypothetical protein